MVNNHRGRPAKQYDWEAIESDYRSGSLSIREIGRRHKICESYIRKKAKEYRWTRDLTNKVRQKVRDELVRTELVRTKSANDMRKDADIIEKASTEIVSRIRIHRKYSKRLMDLVNKLVKLTDSLTPEKKNENTKIEQLQKAAGITRASAVALDKLVTVERKSYNIDESVGDDNAPDAITITYQRTK